MSSLKTKLSKERKLIAKLWNKKKDLDELKTRLFFVVDSKEDNEEIFETLEEAEAYLISVINSGNKGRLYIAMVRNAYYEKDLKSWNYEDYSDTFNIIKVINGKEL